VPKGRRNKEKEKKKKKKRKKVEDRKQKERKKNLERRGMKGKWYAFVCIAAMVMMMMMMMLAVVAAETSSCSSSSSGRSESSGSDPVERRVSYRSDSNKGSRSWTWKSDRNGIVSHRSSRPVEGEEMKAEGYDGSVDARERLSE
jgi:hypothetical protein